MVHADENGAGVDRQAGPCMGRCMGWCMAWRAWCILDIREHNALSTCKRHSALIAEFSTHSCNQRSQLHACAEQKQHMHINQVKMYIQYLFCQLLKIKSLCFSFTLINYFASHVSPKFYFCKNDSHIK